MEQVAHALRQARTVTMDVARSRRLMDAQLMAFLTNDRLHCLDCLIDERANLERFFLQGNSTLRDTRHIEEIIDEPNELIGLTGDHREQTLRIRIGSDQAREKFTRMANR